MSQTTSKKPKILSWDAFKSEISKHICETKGPRLCRGQSNSAWPLVTSFHRNPNGLDLPSYFQYVEHLADVIGTLENRRIDFNNYEERGSFVAYLQHHGFPTPLLDWSLSPYIAAYFAFSDVNEQSPESEYVSIYVFDYLKWIVHWKAIYDYDVTDPHVSVFQPKCLGNRRQIVQQGFIYTLTNVTDISAHIILHEGMKKENYLDIYHLPVNERNYAMTELETMGINAYSLFGSSEALCKYYKESIFRSDKLTKKPLERMVELLKKSEEQKK